MCVCSYVCMLSQVNDNGVISFDRPYNVRAPLLPFPLRGNNMIIAPYWADVDIRGTGNIYFRQTNDTSLHARATREIRAAFPRSLNNEISNLLIATWDRVGYHDRNTDKVNTVIVVCKSKSMHWQDPVSSHSLMNITY